MLALAGINALGLVLFAAAYIAAALRWLSPGAFLAAVVMLFVAITALWVRTERHRAGRRGPLERVGRAAGGLALIVALGPVAMLMPLSLVDARLPAEASIGHVISRSMVVLLVSLALVGLCNLTGGLVQAATALDRIRRGKLSSR